MAKKPDSPEDKHDESPAHNAPAAALVKTSLSRRNRAADATSSRRKAPRESQQISGAVEDPDRAWKVAHLAAQLAQRYPVLPPIEEFYPQFKQVYNEEVDAPLSPFMESTLTAIADYIKNVRNHQQSPAFYERLIIDAHKLLEMAESRAGRVHAAILFEPRPYRFSEIRKIFHGVGWPRLRSDKYLRRWINSTRDRLVVAIVGVRSGPTSAKDAEVTVRRAKNWVFGCLPEQSEKSGPGPLYRIREALIACRTHDLEPGLLTCPLSRLKRRPEIFPIGVADRSP
jgi:hypothetical protein